MQKNKTRVDDSKKVRKVRSTYVPSHTDLVFVSLGGTDEIGMNLGLLGHDGAWLMIDCGITFYDRLGIEVLTADPTFVVSQQKRLKGLLLTHAHEDHIGGVEYLWPLLRCPVYAAPFAAAVLRQKIESRSWKEKLQLSEVEFGQREDIGPFNVEFVRMMHSIPDPTCLVIRSPLGTVVHTGDWKFDEEPVLGKKADVARLREIGDEGVLAYFSDSTNIFTKEDSCTEQQIRKNIIRLVKKYQDKRITVACFSSNIARLETALLAAQESGRKICVVGRSMQKMIVAAKDTGYLRNIPSFIDERTAASMPPGQVLLICTGSQGEDRSALVRIAEGSHPIVKMNEDDLVLFSSRVIPGNEKAIGALHSKLAQAGADIITAAEEDIHVSGHPSSQSIQKMYKLLRPKIVIPVHGEARHLIAQAHFAQEQGIEHVITPSNGTLIQLAGDHPGIVGVVQQGQWAVDGKRMVAFDSNVVKERTRLSEDGVAFVTVVVEKDLVREVLVKLLGLVEKGRANDALQQHIVKCVKDFFKSSSSIESNSENLSAAAHIVSKAISGKIGKRPMVEVKVIEV